MSMSDSGTDCCEGGVLSNDSSSLNTLCDELSSAVIDGRSPNGSRALNHNSSGRQRHNSSSTPSRKCPVKRRRSRSLQLDKSNDLQSEKKPTEKKFVSMAEAMYKFQTCTPQRFHSRPIIDGSQKWQDGQINPSYKKLRCTLPQSPNLISHLRARPVTYLTKEEREEAELRQMQKYVFKAAPLKTEILKEPQLLKKVEPKPVTKPSPFQLTEAKKLTGAAKQVDTSQTMHTNRNIFPDEQQPIACAEHNAVHPVWKNKVAEAVNNTIMEHPGVKKATPSKRATVPAPFTFEERDKIRAQQKQEKIRQVLEEEKRAREFRAQPIPKSVKCPLSQSQSELKCHSPTQPEPFQLYTEERRQLHEASLKAKLEEESKIAEARRFKARPPVVLMKKPFEPVKPNRVLKEITDICLNTELRSKEREKFEMKMKEKEMILEEHRRQLKEEQEREEEEKRARLRKEAIHKAQPIPKYAPIVVAKSTKELTVPQSPFSRTKTNVLYDEDFTT